MVSRLTIAARWAAEQALGAAKYLAERDYLRAQARTVGCRIPWWWGNVRARHHLTQHIVALHQVREGYWS